MAWVNIIDLFYPVGIIIEFNSADIKPGDLFGGTWEQIPSNSSPYKWIRIA